MAPWGAWRVGYAVAMAVNRDPNAPAEGRKWVSVGTL